MLRFTTKPTQCAPHIIHLGLQTNVCPCITTLHSVGLTVHLRIPIVPNVSLWFTLWFRVCLIPEPQTRRRWFYDEHNRATCHAPTYTLSPPSESLIFPSPKLPKLFDSLWAARRKPWRKDFWHFTYRPVPCVVTCVCVFVFVPHGQIARFVTN